jgi:hypothetical protein
MYRIEDHQELPPLKVTEDSITHDRMLEAYRKSVKVSLMRSVSRLAYLTDNLLVILGKERKKKN